MERFSSPSRRGAPGLGPAGLLFAGARANPVQSPQPAPAVVPPEVGRYRVTVFNEGDRATAANALMCALEFDPGRALEMWCDVLS